MDCRRKKECKNCMKYKQKINAPTMAYKTVYGEYPEDEQEESSESSVE